MIYVMREILDQLYHLHSLIRLKVKFTDIKKENILRQNLAAG